MLTKSKNIVDRMVFYCRRTLRQQCELRHLNAPEYALIQHNSRQTPPTPTHNHRCHNSPLPHPKPVSLKVGDCLIYIFFLKSNIFLENECIILKLTHMIDIQNEFSKKKKFKLFFVRNFATTANFSKFSHCVQCKISQKPLRQFYQKFLLGVPVTQTFVCESFRSKNNWWIFLKATICEKKLVFGCFLTLFDLSQIPPIFFH